MAKHTQPIDPLAPLIETIRASLRDEILNELRAEIRAKAADEAPGRVMLSIDAACTRYGLGRKGLKRYIREGRIPVTRRRCRGGSMGAFLHLADCERVLGGRKS